MVSVRPMSARKQHEGQKPWEVEGPPDIAPSRKGPKQAPTLDRKGMKKAALRKATDNRRRAEVAAAVLGMDEPDEDGVNMPQGQKLRLERFVSEYIKDFKATAAIQRMGYTYSRAIAYVTPWFNHPYVQRRIYERVRELEADDVVARGQIMAGLLREANTAQDAATRTRAWAELGKLKGMYIQKVEVKQEVRHHGVMLVPAPQGLDAWSKDAASRQAALKSHATHNRQN